MAPSKLPRPFLARLGGVISNVADAKNLTTSQWSTLADRYYHLHAEGHEWETLRETSGLWVPDEYLGQQGTPTTDLGQIVGGVWPLQEDDATSDSVITTRVNTALGFNNVRGFSWRFHAEDTVNPTTGAYVTTRLDFARNIVRTWNQNNPTKQRSLALRPIFGRYTPAYWTLNAPAGTRIPDYALYSYGSNNAAPWVPHPCLAGTSNATNQTRNGAVAPTGQAGQPNTYFEAFFRAWWRDFFIPYAQECEATYGVTCRLLHSGWYGFQYSELYYGPPVQSPNSGYSSTQWREAHKRLVDIVAEELPPTHVTEFGLSGHGAIVGSSNPAIEELCDRMVLRFGAGSDRVYASANGWDETSQSEDQIFGAGSDRTTEANKQNALEARDCRVELQHIYSNGGCDWDRAGQFAYGDVVGTAPNLHTLGRGAYATKGVWLLEPYAIQFTQGTFLPHLQRLCDGFSAHLAALNTTGSTTSANKFSVYVNGSYVTQSLFEEKWAAHAERHYPLGISTWWPSGSQVGMGRLSTALTASATTVSLFRTGTGIPASAHPNGTAAAAYPLIRSTKATVTTTTFSDNTASYVSWIRVDDEIIGLPSSAANFSYNATTQVLTVTGCVRGMWGTTATTHAASTGLTNAAGARVFAPVYIGNNNAAASDSNLSGNPFRNDVVYSLRYGIRFWDNGSTSALKDGARFIADQCRRELEGREATKAVVGANATSNTLTVTAHGYSVADRIAVFGSAIPAPLASHTPYFVTTVPTADTFTLSPTQGGTAVDLTSAVFSDCRVARIYRRTPASTGNVVWLDVSSERRYNNADPYGGAIEPWDDVAGAAATDASWQARQITKASNLTADLVTGDGFTGLTFSVNNLGPTSSNLRTAAIDALDNVYDWCVLEHWMQDSATMGWSLDQLCQAMANNYKIAAWVKQNEFNNSVDSATTRGRYIRRAYGAYLLGYRPLATNPQLIGGWWPTTLTAEPTDWTTDGEAVQRHLFRWDFGTPTSPANPASASDLLDATSGLYVRTYSKGLVLVNLTSTAKIYALPAGSGGGGGSTPAEDMRGVWAAKQLSAQTGTGSIVDVDAQAADIAGWFIRMPWYLIQTGPSTYDWRAFDAAVTAAEAQGVKVRLCVMFGSNTPRPPSPPAGSGLAAGWLTTTYPWFQGSATSPNDTANKWLPVPWDPLVLAAQTNLINTFCARYRDNPTVLAFTTSGPSTTWQELALPDNTTSQPGWVSNTATLLPVWTDTLDKWNAARGTTRVHTMVSAAPSFYTGLPTAVINACIAKFGSDCSVQWNFLDVNFTNGVNSNTATWKDQVMCGWQAWGLTTTASRLVTGADADTTTGSQQDADAVEAMVRLAKDAGAIYVEVYDTDIGLPSSGGQFLIRNACETIHAEMAPAGGGSGAGNTWYDVLSETSGNGTLATASGTVTVPAWDARFYLSDTTTQPPPTGAPGLVTPGSTTTVASGTSCAIVPPDGAAAGDLMIAAIQCNAGAATFTAPSGWTLIRQTAGGSGTAVNLATYYRVATASEPTSYTWTISTGSAMFGAIHRVTNTSGATSIDASAGQYNMSSTSATAPTVTTTGTNRLLIYISQAQGNAQTTVVAPSGMTEAFENLEGTSRTQEWATETALSAATTGPRVGTLGTAANNAAQLIAIGGDPTIVDTDSATLSETGFVTVVATDSATFTELGSVQASTPVTSSAPTLVASGTTATSITSGSFVINKPTGVTNGDVLFAAVQCNAGAQTITGPSGWTLIRNVAGGTGTSVNLSTYYKVISNAAGEAASYTWTVGGNGAYGEIHRITGADISTPIDDFDGQYNASSTSAAAPSVTSTVANTLLVYVVQAGGGALTGITAQNGMSETWEHLEANSRNQEVATETRATAGATGTRTSTLSSAAASGTQLVVVRPVATQTVAAAGTDSVTLTETGRVVSTGASGTDSATLTETPGNNLTGTDSATLSERPANNLTGTDGVTLTEQPVNRPISVTDTVTFTEQSVLRAVTGTDSAALAEAGSTANLFVGTDGATLTEGVPARGAVTTDTATLSESPIARTISTTDSVTVSETSIVGPSSADTATVTDASSLAPTVVDAGTLIETGSLAVAVTASETITETPGAVLATASSVQVPVGGIDSANLADAGAVVTVFAGTDTVTLTEGAISNEQASTDSAILTDTGLGAFAVPDADSAEVADASAPVAASSVPTDSATLAETIDGISLWDTDAAALTDNAAGNISDTDGGELADPDGTVATSSLDVDPVTVDDMARLVVPTTTTDASSLSETGAVEPITIGDDNATLAERTDLITVAIGDSDEPVLTEQPEAMTVTTTDSDDGALSDPEGSFYIPITDTDSATASESTVIATVARRRPPAGKSRRQVVIPTTQQKLRNR
jgi:hypothetical protein